LLCTLIVGAGVGLIIDIPAVAWALGLSGLNRDWIYYTSLTMNGVVLCLSIVAFQIAIHEYKENFIFWMCSNACVLLLWSLSIARDVEVGVIIGVYTSAFTLFTYVFSAANSVFGYINWSKKQISI
jgi:nicotinamide riboside transporter PnuC